MVYGSIIAGAVEVISVGVCGVKVQRNKIIPKQILDSE